jgi:hypothetical protein
MRLFDAYMMHQRICRAVIQMCHSSVVPMLRDLCNKGGETSMDSPLETALIDGNFVSIRMQRGLSVSDWLCLRVKSSLLVGTMSFCSGRQRVVPQLVAVKFLLDRKYVSIHSERRLNS